MRNSNLYYIYTDHLNTPRAITDTANNMQWVWENKEAFGNNAPNEIISGFKFNLRFPGQYFDNETNLNYNIHRDYNPVWGRYTTSDPLGLAAGINTYGYVGGNSLGLSDDSGLLPELPMGLVYFSAGFGDSASFGLTSVLRDNVSFLGGVDKMSNYYIAGEVTDICSGIFSFGLSNALKASIRNLSKSQRKEIAKEARRTPAYNKIKAPGITPHHINPLFGHIGNKPAFFPTGALPLSINSSSYNLKGLSHMDHVQTHRKLFQLEQGYSSYQSTIILRAQNDYLRK